MRKPLGRKASKRLYKKGKKNALPQRCAPPWRYPLMRLYTIVDDISNKKIHSLVEFDDDGSAKRAFAFGLSNKTGPLALVAFRPIDFRLVCVGAIDLEGNLTPCDPYTICRMDELTEVK